MRIKKKKQNEYLLTEDKIWVRNLCKKAPYFDLNNLATKAKFQWVGLEFETGTLVEDKDGNVWEVISNSNTIKKFGNLAVVPFGSTKTKGSSNIKTIKPDQWKKNAWKFNTPDFSKVTLHVVFMILFRLIR